MTSENFFELTAEDLIDMDNPDKEDRLYLCVNMVYYKYLNDICNIEGNTYFENSKTGNPEQLKNILIDFLSDVLYHISKDDFNDVVSREYIKAVKDLLEKIKLKPAQSVKSVLDAIVAMYSGQAYLYLLSVHEFRGCTMPSFFERANNISTDRVASE